MGFKIKGTDTCIKSKQQPTGVGVEFHISANPEEEGRKLCEDKGIVNLVYCRVDF